MKKINLNGGEYTEQELLKLIEDSKKPDFWIERDGEYYYLHVKNNYKLCIWYQGLVFVRNMSDLVYWVADKLDCLATTSQINKSVHTTYHIFFDIKAPTFGYEMSSQWHLGTWIKDKESAKKVVDLLNSPILISAIKDGLGFKNE